MNWIERTNEIIQKMSNHASVPPEWMKLNLRGKLELIGKMVDEMIARIEEAPDCDNCNRIDPENPPEPRWMP